MPKPHKISNEYHLLILLSHRQLDQRTIREACRHSDIPINWDIFIKLATRHRLLPLIHSNLKKHPFKFIPKHIAQHANDVFIINASRNIRLFAALCELTEVFSAHDIPAIPFKGLTLSELAYGDICYRQIGDLDFLVPWQNVVGAFRMLEAAGYRSELAINARQFQKFIATENSIDLYHAQKQIQVELHWRTMDIYVGFPTDFESYAVCAKTVHVQNQEFLHFGIEDLLFYLMLHATKHAWDHLELVCCISELIKNHEINWDRLIEIATKNRCTRILYLSLFLANDLYGAKIPESIRRKFEKKGCIKTLSDVVYSKYLFPIEGNDENSISTRYSLFHLKAKDHLADRFLYCLKITTMPTIKEWLLIPLPASLSFLHYGIRPIRLCVELVQRLFQKTKFIL